MSSLKNATRSYKKALRARIAASVAHTKAKALYFTHVKARLATPKIGVTEAEIAAKASLRSKNDDLTLANSRHEYALGELEDELATPYPFYAVVYDL